VKTESEIRERLELLKHVWFINKWFFEKNLNTNFKSATDYDKEDILELKHELETLAWVLGEDLDFLNDWPRRILVVQEDYRKSIIAKLDKNGNLVARNDIAEKVKEQSR
jgi:hypothetical protein